MKVSRKFFSYVIPSVLAFTLSGIYCIADGFFVGNYIGDNGLSAVNIVYPIVMVIQAIGTGIGMGGAVHYSINHAREQGEKAGQYERSAIFLLFAASVIMTALINIFLAQIIKGTGVAGEIAAMGGKYLRIVTGASICQIFGTGLIPLVRNRQGSLWAMVFMIIGFLTNIILDYVFIGVLGYGVAGAAAATAIGQLLTAAFSICFLLGKNRNIIHPFIRWKYIKDILIIGASSFGVTVCPAITLFLINRFLIIYSGSLGVACYAVIAYVTYMVYLLLQGVGDGSQPLMSDYYGRSDRTRLKKIRIMAFVSAGVVALTGIAVLYFTRGSIGGVFGTSEEVSRMISGSLPIVLIGFIFLAYTRVETALFYAVEESAKAMISIYSEVVFLFLLLLALPGLFGPFAIWWSIPLSQAMACMLTVIIKAAGAKRNVR